MKEKHAKKYTSLAIELPTHKILLDLSEKTGKRMFKIAEEAIKDWEKRYFKEEEDWGRRI